MAKTVPITIDAMNVPQVVRIIAAADELAAAVRVYGLAKLRNEQIMRDGEPLLSEYMRVVGTHDAYVALRADAEFTDEQILEEWRAGRLKVNTTDPDSAKEGE